MLSNEPQRRQLHKGNGMKLPRRKFLHLAACAAALPAVSRIARAQAYPTRPVRIIVGFPAGGNADTIARVMGQWLSERLGQPFVVENRTGAATNIAAEAVVRSPPDGYTLLFVTSANATNATLYEKLNFNFMRDIAPVAATTRSPLVLEVHPAFSPSSLTEFISYAKANPGKITLASFGTATVSHLAGELFKTMAGINLLHVPSVAQRPCSLISSAARSRHRSTTLRGLLSSSNCASYDPWR